MYLFTQARAIKWMENHFHFSTLHSMAAWMSKMYPNDKNRPSKSQTSILSISIGMISTNDGDALMISWRSLRRIWISSSVRRYDFSIQRWKSPGQQLFTERHYRSVEVECILFEVLFSHIEANLILIFIHSCDACPASPGISIYVVSRNRW